jgi:hypothetical protein
MDAKRKNGERFALGNANVRGAHAKEIHGAT